MLVIFQYPVHYIVLRILCLNYTVLISSSNNYLENNAWERKIINLTKWFTTIKWACMHEFSNFWATFFLCKIDINCVIFELTASLAHKLQKMRKEYINHRQTKALPFYIVNNSLDTMVTDITPACINRL